MTLPRNSRVLRTSAYHGSAKRIDNQPDHRPNGSSDRCGLEDKWHWVYHQLTVGSARSVDQTAVRRRTDSAALSATRPPASCPQTLAYTWGISWKLRFEHISSPRTTRHDLSLSPEDVTTCAERRTTRIDAATTKPWRSATPAQQVGESRFSSSKGWVTSC
jgi:hypothetical protein